MRFYTKEEDEILIKNYKNMQLKDIKKNLLQHRSYSSLKRRKKSLGLLKRKYTSVNENFFDTPNLINCAIAGFIAADGCVSTNNRLIFKLSIKDLEFLENIKILMGICAKIYIQKCDRRGWIKDHYINFIGKYCSLYTWETKRWAENLKKHWNIVPRKTLILQPPNINELDLQLAFCSGNLDGDGAIVLNKNEKYNLPFCLRLGFMGTPMLLNWIKNIFDDLTPNNQKGKTHDRTNANVTTYVLSGVRAYIASKMLLILPIPRLERKWQLARQYIDLIESKDLSIEMLKKLHVLISKEIKTFVSERGGSFPNFTQKYVEKTLKNNHGILTKGAKKQMEILGIDLQNNKIDNPTPELII